MALTEKQKQYRRDWYHTHKEAEYASTRRHQKKNPIAFLCNRIKQRCIKKGIKFDLTTDYLKEIWTGRCPVFDTEIKLNVCEGRRPRDTEHVASIDRIDPNKGYVRSNVRWFSMKANFMKSDSTPEEMKKFATWILNNL